MKRGNSQKHILDFLAFLFVTAFVVAFFKIPAHQSANGTLNYFKAKEETVSEWFSGLGDRYTLSDLFNGNATNPDGSGSTTTGTSNGNGTGSGSANNPGDALADALPPASNEPGAEGDPSTSTGSPGGEAPELSVDEATAYTSLIVIGDANTEGGKYKRDEWKHWGTVTGGAGSCWDTRDEVLYRQSADVNSLVLVDKKGKVVDSKSKACAVKSGTWNDPYTGQVFTDPGNLDIDHMIPLGYTAKHNGQAWSSEKKEAYANYLDDPTHLVAVDASANRSKGDKGPSAWKPKSPYQCYYAKAWTNVSVTWNITNTQSDVNALNEMLATCTG